MVIVKELLISILENARNNNINFLDLNIQINDNKMITNWYRKPIYTNFSKSFQSIMLIIRRVYHSP